MSSAAPGRAPRATALCGAVVAAAGLIAAFWALPDLQRFFFVWDHNFGPAVSYACGRPFADVARPAPELIDFLNRRRPTFDCALIPQDAQFAPLNAYANGIPYFLRGLGLYWRWRGVAWPNLAPLFSVLYAGSNVLVFLLFRQLLGNGWGLASSIVYVFSPSNYYSVTYYEHFAKVPIFLGIMLLVVSLARAPSVSSRRLFAASIVGGLLLGIGFGIRADLWLLTAPCLAAMLFFCGADRRPAWPVRSGACVVLLATAIVTALPAIVTNGRSYFWLQLVEGLSTDFNADLSIRPGIYEWVPKYSDELGASWMQAHSTNGPLDVADWQGQERAGRTAYLAVMKHFPADFITRPVAAVLKVIVESLGTQPAFAAQFAPAAPNFFTQTALVWRTIASLGVWLVFALGAGLFGVALADRRLALFYLLLVVYIGGSTAVVFLPRHRWHLYFVGFLLAGVVAKFVVAVVRMALTPMTSRSPTDTRMAVAQSAAPRRRTVRPVLVVVAIAGCVVVVSRAYQDREVGRLVQSVLAAEKEPLRIERRAADAKPMAVASDLVERFESNAAERARFQYADYVTATFSRDECRPGAATMVYRASQPAYDFTMSVPLDFSGDSRSFTYAFPAYAVKYDRAFGFFVGIETPADSPRCLSGAWRATHPSALSLLITWHLPERWADMRRHQTIVFPPGARR